MHSFETVNKTRFDYNGDFSGHVIVTDKDGDTVRVPYECLDNLVAHKMARDVTERVESMSSEELVTLIGKSEVFK